MGNVGRLEPGETYIYEKADGITYARKLGDPPGTRFEIGRDYAVGTMFGMPVSKIANMVDMMNAANDIPALQDALERAKVIYELSKKEQTIFHHSV